MTLSPEQIQVLFDFTKKKYVHFYDLQSEIVDHLAAAIEDKISENNKLSFEDALAEVYEGFGIFGFAHVVREKEKQIDKHAQRMLWKEIVSLFTWPHLISSMLVLVSIYTLTLLLSLSLLLGIVAGIYLIMILIYFIGLAKKPKAIRVLRMLNYYQPGLNILPTSYAQLYLNFYSDITLPIFIGYTFCTFIYMLASYKVNAKIKSNALALYPEAFNPIISK